MVTFSNEKVKVIGVREGGKDGEREGGNQRGGLGNLF